MKRPQPDIGAAIRDEFVGTVGRNRKFKRFWGTETVSSTEVLHYRRHYYPDSLRPTNYELLWRFLGVTEDLEEADNSGIDSAWFFLNKSKGNEDFLVPATFVTTNLNRAFWDTNDGPVPPDLKLITTISIGANYTTSDANTIVDPGITVAEQAQQVIDNYETLWATHQITQEGPAVLHKGTTYDDTYKISLPDEEDISPDDPWVALLTRYALRDDGIPCTITDVEVGISENLDHLYNTTVVTLEIPYVAFSDSDPMVQRILQDNDTSQFPPPPIRSVRDATRFKVFQANNHSNEQTTQNEVRMTNIYEIPEDMDDTSITRSYLDWQDNYIGTSTYQDMWIKSGNLWYLKTEVFTDPRKYGITQKKLHDYLWTLIDTGYKKKKVPWWKKLIAVIIFVVVAIITWFSSGATKAWLKAAYALVVASFAVSLFSLVLSAVGAHEMAMAFMEVNKAVEPLVQIAQVVILVTGIINANEAANQAAAEAAKEAGTEVVTQSILESALDSFIDPFIQGFKDLFAGSFTVEAMGSTSKLVQAYTMMEANKIKSINSKNKDLQAEYEDLTRELQQESDAMQGFMNIYPKPATADWSMYASLFDLPYERGGGNLSMGNIQRTTKQALRKAKYEMPVFENIKIV